MSLKILPQFHIQTSPTANPASIVSGPHVRFTVLTARLFRLEYSPSGSFEDRPSQAFWYRQQPVPVFTSTNNGEIIEIDSEYLHFQYHDNDKGFTSNSL